MLLQTVLLTLFVVCTQRFIDAAPSRTSADAVIPCLTPNATKGICIDLQLCPSILIISENYEANITIDTLQFLIKSQCGFDGTKPRVCCPLTDPGASFLYQEAANNQSKPNKIENNHVPETTRPSSNSKPKVCLTPSMTKGLCVQLKSCAAIDRVSNDFKRPLTLETFFYLKNSMCGFERTDVKVCCPMVNLENPNLELSIVPQANEKENTIKSDVLGTAT